MPHPRPRPQRKLRARTCCSVPGRCTTCDCVSALPRAASRTKPSPSASQSSAQSTYACSPGETLASEPDKQHTSLAAPASCPPSPRLTRHPSVGHAHPPSSILLRARGHSPVRPRPQTVCPMAHLQLEGIFTSQQTALGSPSLQPLGLQNSLAHSVASQLIKTAHASGDAGTASPDPAERVAPVSDAPATAAAEGGASLGSAPVTPVPRGTTARAGPPASSGTTGDETICASSARASEPAAEADSGSADEPAHAMESVATAVTVGPTGTVGPDAIGPTAS